MKSVLVLAESSKLIKYLTCVLNLNKGALEPSPPTLSMGGGGWGDNSSLEIRWKIINIEILPVKAGIEYQWEIYQKLK